jgi:hypothetical protein
MASRYGHAFIDSSTVVFDWLVETKKSLQLALAALRLQLLFQDHPVT